MGDAHGARRHAADPARRWTRVGYWSLEVWGGATFDAALRFLDENPWERLRIIKQHCPKTPLQMLLRGQNLVGYRHYSDDIVRRFVHASKRNGIDVFRVFDALNDIRNVEVSARGRQGVRRPLRGRHQLHGLPRAHARHATSSTRSSSRSSAPTRSASRTWRACSRRSAPRRWCGRSRSEIGLPVHVHCHYIGGMAPMNYLKAVEAGADIIDTAVVALAFGNSQPAVEMIVAALKESPYDTGLDLDLLFEIAEYWEDVREKQEAQARHHHAAVTWRSSATRCPAA